MITFNKNGETKKIATYSACISDITVSDPQNWGISSSAVQGELNLTVPSNGGGARQETITISYKAASNSCSKQLEIYQDSGSVNTVFKFCDSTTSKSLVFDSSRQSSEPLCVTSTSGGSVIGFTIANNCSWITAATTSTGVTITVDNNLGGLRTCSFNLVQNDTGSRLAITVTQEGSSTECERFIDSCCGVSEDVHPGYDIELNSNIGSSSLDSTEGNIMISADPSTVPSWIGYTYTSGSTYGTITYTATTENNTGMLRYGTITYNLVTNDSGKNLCSTADVVVRQKPKRESMISITVSLQNSTSSTLTVERIRFFFNNSNSYSDWMTSAIGQDLVVGGGDTEDFTWYIPADFEGATFRTTNQTWIKTVEGNGRYFPVDNQTIRNGGTYEITFN